MRGVPASRLYHARRCRVRALSAAEQASGPSPLPNVRIRGKIPKEEWPKIATRFRSGETFTQIARAYHCTAPAIRYIVERASSAEGRRKIEREAQSKIALLAPLVAARRRSLSGTAEARSQGRPSRGNFAAGSPVKEIWGQINIDIATFLAAMEVLSLDDSEENYRALLDATDRLLWGSARTRLELERILSGAKKGPAVRRASV